MMMMRYVLFVCVLCVWCACGCEGDEAGAGSDGHNCGTSGKEKCPGAKNGSLGPNDQTANVAARGDTEGGDEQLAVDDQLCTAGEPGDEKKVPCAPKAGPTGRIVNSLADGQSPGGGGPTGPKGSIVLSGSTPGVTVKGDPGGNSGGGGGGTDRLENTGVVCTAGAASSTNCPDTAQLQQTQQQQLNHVVKDTKGSTVNVGEHTGNTPVGKGVRGNTPSEQVETNGAGDTDDSCVNGTPKVAGKVCNTNDSKTIQTSKRVEEKVQTQTEQTSEAKGNTPGTVGEKNGAPASGAPPSAPDSPETESAAEDHPNGEPAESTAQAAVEQSDAVQSQTSSASTSTSATEATGSSQPGSSPSTDKGQDPKAADSSSGGASTHTGPLLLFVMWLGGLAMTAAC
ncbi:hypothetical protein DQ04_13111010 [Trypanosoma grayi]|uniref:hypothetical protein n=1 Tax=Trypanosoma grayi TaxID=71804 RepID=UPI0004F4AA5C|nr:hypothetical protein DQ04_13111010 [Trypanosoma grayi]KEG06603.1 hypothetical protein DQ04_13111010 [Trypanosoma grayi]